MFLFELMPLHEAFKIIDASIKKVGTEKIPIGEAHNRVIAQKIVGKFNSPPFDRSAMDGYALRAEDTFGHSEENPVQLKIVDRIGAGYVSTHPLQEGEAIQIATGAPLPQGANAVVMEEYTNSDGDDLEVEMAVVPHENVSPSGEDFQKNDLLLSPGKILKAPDIGLIASAGYSNIEVYKRVRVGCLITGSELVMPKEKLEGAEIINSNHFTIQSLVKESMGTATMSHCPDNPDQVHLEFQRLLQENDVLITTGGTAISKGDVVVDVAADLGEVNIHGVSLRPGKPFAFGKVMGKPVFMLSGYPVAAMVQFDVFTRGSLHKMQGLEGKFEMTTKKASKKIPSSLGRTDYIRAIIEGDFVHPLKIKGSGIIRSMVESDAYIIISENSEGVGKGEQCQVLPYHSLKI